ncbi:MAG: N-(5'-phosphoribosyl)anthranilate isomerase, partial [Deltaproteobacteria bacterium]|nr:N-(5'-phosphoribosyl)anthranilate isomerase [Deltaproteobacteria bacterium]
GLNFYPPSPRCLSLEQAQTILSEIPEEVCRVAVFVNEPKEKVRKMLTQLGLL